MVGSVLKVVRRLVSGLARLSRVVFRGFFPSRCLKSACGVPFRGLCRRKCQKMVFSVSGALIPRNTPTSRHTGELFRELERVNFRDYLLSGGRGGHMRVFGRRVRARCVCGTLGPTEGGCLRTVRVVKASRTGALFINSRLFASM